MLNIEKAKVYGVDNVGASDPNALVRTDDAVGLSYTVGNSEIKSDFDRCYPYCDMQEVTDKEGNVFIKIPKFYCKITKNTDGTYKHQISGVRYEGFSTLFVDGFGNEIDYVLVGKYEGSGSSAKVFSKSGETVLVSITLDNFRAGCKANGAGYQSYDFLIDLIIKELWLIEMKTTHSQSIMAGYTNGNNTAALITGHTDTIKTPSGSGNVEHGEECVTCNTDGSHAMKYRGIENLWGNTWTFVDGISFNAEKVFVCTDPESYKAGKTDSPYVYHGNRLATNSVYISKVEPLDRNPLIQFATAAGGSTSTYYGDYYWYSSSGTILLVGGSWSSGGAYAGLWYWDGSVGASVSSSVFGGRLCYKPL